MAQWRSARRDQEDGVRFSRPLYLTLLAIALILVAFDRPESRVEPLTTVRAAFNDITSPALELAAWPLRGLRNMGPWWRRQFELAEENRELRERLTSANAWRDVALSLRERVQLYEQALNLDSPDRRERISAWTVAESSGPFVHSQLLGVGAEDGVRTGYPVINVYGLVGRTIDVGQRSSRVLMLNDLNSRIAVMADRSNARALVVGDNSEFPRLEYLGREPDLEEGDRIVTSGDDNVLPRGLPVGQAFRDDAGAWRVALYSDAGAIDLVWVWPFEPVPTPEENPAGRSGFDDAPGAQGADVAAAEAGAGSEG
jgi:rod shape-determining protein MreC